MALARHYTSLKPLKLEKPTCSFDIKLQADTKIILQDSKSVLCVTFGTVFEWIYEK